MEIFNGYRVLAGAMVSIMKLKSFFAENFNKLRNGYGRLEREALVFFAPGVFLVFLAFVVLVAPTFFVALIASSLFFFGVLFMLLAWKFISFKRKVKEMVKHFQGSVFVQSVEIPREEFTQSETVVDDKKIILH